MSQPYGSHGLPSVPLPAGAPGPARFDGPPTTERAISANPSIPWAIVALAVTVAMGAVMLTDGAFLGGTTGPGGTNSDRIFVAIGAGFVLCGIAMAFTLRPFVAHLKALYADSRVVPGEIVSVETSFVGHRPTVRFEDEQGAVRIVSLGMQGRATVGQQVAIRYSRTTPRLVALDAPGLDPKLFRALGAVGWIVALTGVLLIAFGLPGIR